MRVLLARSAVTAGRPFYMAMAVASLIAVIITIMAAFLGGFGLAAALGRALSGIELLELMVDDEDAEEAVAVVGRGLEAVVCGACQRRGCGTGAGAASGAYTCPCGRRGAAGQDDGCRSSLWGRGGSAAPPGASRGRFPDSSLCGTGNGRRWRPGGSGPRPAAYNAHGMPRLGSAFISPLIALVVRTGEAVPFSLARAA